ncbi:hypothetical protein F5877DRAFT_84304 [Lentinula edodes]|nr:hypothetical protein F5877DRAFT_84304 [Lentinula edodes]
MSYRVYMPVILEELGFKVTERWFDEVEPHAGEAGFISNPRARCLDCNSWSARHHRLACRYTASLETMPNPFTEKETLLESDEPEHDPKRFFPGVIIRLLSSSFLRLASVYASTCHLPGFANAAFEDNDVPPGEGEAGSDAE